jgi:hypothetical protein
MNTIEINRVLTKEVKYFQGVYPLYLLPSTITKPAVIIVSLNKHYMPGSHLVALYFSDSGCADISIPMVSHN